VIGHADIIERFKRLKSTDQLGHAYLLVGERGIGKMTASREIAAVLLCSAENPPCGTCHECVLRAAGNHPDSIELPEEGSLGIKVIRELRDQASMRPHSAALRVIIIPSAERLAIPAQNALLKLLEEPPGNTVLILTAPGTAALLPTTVSRCQVIALHPPTDAEVLASVEGASPELLELVGGSPGRVVELLADPAEAARLKEYAEWLSEAESAPLTRRMILARMIAEDDPKGVLETWISVLRRRVTQGVSPRDAANAEVLLAARQALDYNSNVQLVIENALLKLGD
jgi:DNA polymerase III delta' subunit